MNIFSVQAATGSGASVKFFPNHAELVKNGVKFKIVKEGKLYFLNDVITTTYVKKLRSIEEWHRTLGHCNVDDLIKLESCVDGMEIGGKGKFLCAPCLEGKMTQSISKKPMARATAPLEFVSSDVCGPIEPMTPEGFKYALTFTDNYSGFIFPYFLKAKSDAVVALEKFIADVSPVGKIRNLVNMVPESVVKTLRSDGGGEYMGFEFKNVLISNKIKHEQSSPHSPHQNGVAERGWRTLFEMGRCMLSESKVQKNLWHYAIMAAAYTRNRCYQQRTKNTPYFLLTGRKPDLSKMHPFGSICFSYIQEHKSKLDPRSKQL